jgi:hypothetical protein
MIDMGVALRCRPRDHCSGFELGVSFTAHYAQLPGAIGISSKCEVSAA